MSHTTEVQFWEHLLRIKDAIAGDSKQFPTGVLDWDRHWAQLGANLVAHYSEPNRHYHNLAHVVEGLELLVSHDAQILTQLAYVYHDVIYVAGAQHGMNERASALYANQQLESFLDLDSRTYITDCITATIDHQIPHGFTDENGDLALLLDVDLAGLGVPKEKFLKRTEDIYAEYIWSISAAEFEAGSKIFAENMLKRHAFGGIFKTAAFAHLEDQAVTNLKILENGGFTSC